MMTADELIKKYAEAKAERKRLYDIADKKWREMNEIAEPLKKEWFKANREADEALGVIIRLEKQMEFMGLS